MLKSKLWHSKTKINNVKGAKMTGLFETCDEYLHKFNFGLFLSSLIASSPLPLSTWRKLDFQKILPWGNE